MPREIEIEELSRAANKRALGHSGRLVGVWLASVVVLGVALWAFAG